MKRILVLSVFIAESLQLNAQRVLTFEEAVKIGLKNGVMLNQQRNNLELSQAQKVQSQAGIGPNVSLNGSASQISGNSFNNNTGAVVNGIRDNISGTVNANLNLFSGFSRFNTIKQFANQLDAQSYLVNRTAQDLINTISTQYLQVLLDKELLKIAKENYDVTDKQLLQVKDQVALGAKSQVDEYNQEALTKSAELSYIQAEITLNNDKTLLTQTLLIDPFDQYEVVKPEWDANKIGSDSFTIEALAETAKQHRGDYLRAEKNERAAKFGAAASKSNMLPSLFAFGTYGSAYNFQHNVPDFVESKTSKTIVVNDPSSASGYSLQQQTTTSIIENPEKDRTFGQQFRSDNVYKQYGLQLSIPIFSGLQNRAAYVQQKNQYENSQLTKKNLEFQIKNDVIRALKNYEYAKKAFTVSLDQLKSAELALQFETERYNLGITSFVDYANANRVYVQSQTDKAQSEYRLLFQKIAIDYATGTLKTDDFE